jgi:hypothetical protein
VGAAARLDGEDREICTCEAGQRARGLKKCVRCGCGCLCGGEATGQRLLLRAEVRMYGRNKSRPLAVQTRLRRTFCIFGLHRIRPV